ncbi:MAG TPA: dihydropteroate synthase [Burkholderiales bacterium]|jgi:dihydropteroate synthase|nr:dihydropteroate synthase [Burkholderiales bacterium]
MRPLASRLSLLASLRAGRFSLTLERPLIMGVVNVTPDSFSDGGCFFGAQQAVEHARILIDEGADILDIGGESSRPGAEPVSLDEELRRVMPVLEKLAGLSVPVSVDTCKPEVMRCAIAAGAVMVNDINALREPGTLEAVAESQAAVCLMHMQGEPRTMQQDPHYEDVVSEVAEFLARRVDAALQAGIARERIVIDPGFGFGKKTAHNLELLRGLRRIADLGQPVLVGLSRKSLFGKITGKPVADRVSASVAAALLAAERGAALVRVHDVAATRDALLVLNAIERHPLAKD